MSEKESIDLYCKIGGPTITIQMPKGARYIRKIGWRNSTLLLICRTESNMKYFEEVHKIIKGKYYPPSITYVP